MDLWRILRRDALRNMQPLLLLAVLAAALNLALLTSLNSALVIMDDPEGLQRLLFIFLLSAFSWRFAQGWMMNAASKRMQAALAILRVDLLRRAVAADLPDAMAVGSARLAQVAGPELQLLAQAVPTLVISFQSVAAIILCLLYLATLSNAAVLIVLGFLTIGGILIARSVLRLERLSETIHEAEGALSERSDHILQTLRECKLNRRRAANALSDATTCAEALRTERHRFGAEYSHYFTLSELTYYAALAGIIFLLPAVTSTNIATVVLAGHAAAFIAYPVITIVASYPSYISAETAARSYLAVEAELKAPPRPAQRRAKDAPPTGFTDFATIALDGASYRHAGRDGTGSFTVGPINLTVERGDVVFVTGHNGAGKSTLIHMLLGLYPAQRGSLTVDGTVVTADTLGSYRDLFSVVFSDNHVTRQLYGAVSLEDGFADELLDLLEMSDKVAVEDRAFTTVDLSQGQKKRLALAAALLERKPVLVLDEWAADQSPYFRRKFYREIIPWMKARGITVIAVTHDDAYFDAADVQIQVEQGGIRRLDTPALPAPDLLPA
ncbi:ATP-binding cassette domain-containing protein [Azospirillum sp. YIM DDC1]|uniref:ATP-binding cassette domain-containing protein n=1 Tax=Azospirillum aestuarii TaxID=2802052 RepID=A0ABS1I1S8_9PROT|nr:ATP-binding cassette domain-containing protein [Azospirillum aestuarii]MBK3774389.1 ATP-binding cassette domain-containing protein [Azospirillum brasilense]MBK4721025.1 ATP-binding cassette domain-containing protein [Azospirillum aestuarii]